MHSNFNVLKTTTKGVFLILKGAGVKVFLALGLDQISYGLIMQELERGDSGIRSTSSVQSSLVMYPIWKYGNEKQRRKMIIQFQVQLVIKEKGVVNSDIA